MEITNVGNESIQDQIRRQVPSGGIISARAGENIIPAPKHVVSIWLEGVPESLETVVDPPIAGTTPEDTLQNVAMLIPQHGSKWITIGDLYLNTYNIRAVSAR